MQYNEDIECHIMECRAIEGGTTSDGLLLLLILAFLLAFGLFVIAILSTFKALCGHPKGESSCPNDEPLVSLSCPLHPSKHYNGDKDNEYWGGIIKVNDPVHGPSGCVVA